MPFAEYPKTNYSDTDFRELIELYKTLVSNYDGTLKQITELSNKLEKYVRSMPPYVQSMLDNAIRPYLSECRNSSLILKSSIENVQAELDKEIARRKVEDTNILDEIEAFRKLFTTLEKTYDSKLSEMRLMILSSNSFNRKMVEEAVTECKKMLSDIPLSTLPIFDPIKLDLESVSGAISNMYNYGITSNGFTAGEFHKQSHITTQFFKDSEISCIDFWTNGKPILRAYKNEHMTFSPITGEYTTIEKVLAQIANELKVYAITAKEYDSKEMIAENYDSKNVTAENYDFNGKGVLTDV